jgi:hypothetical protein
LKLNGHGKKADHPLFRIGTVQIHSSRLAMSQDIVPARRAGIRLQKSPHEAGFFLGDGA